MSDPLPVSLRGGDGTGAGPFPSAHVCPVWDGETFFPLSKDR